MDRVRSILAGLALPGPGEAVSAKALPAGTATALVGRDQHSFVHLLVRLDSKPPSWVTKLSTQAVHTQLRQLTIGGVLSDFLDMRLLGNESSPISTPFLGFIEDFADRVALVSKEDVLFTLRLTFNKWQEAWSPLKLPFSESWIRGLMGELLFLELAVKVAGPRFALAWQGPKAPQDFSRKKVGFEVKSARSVPYRPHISSIDQLDEGPFSVLYLVCVLLEEGDTGESLASVTRRVRQMLAGEPDAAVHFDGVLAAFGYESDAAQVHEERFICSSIDFFLIDDDFPRIRRSSFADAIDERVLGLGYQVTTTGIDPIKSDVAAVVQAMKAAAF